MRIVIAGAGSIGCHVGGWLAHAGRQVTLLLRPRLAERLGQTGLHLTDCDGRNCHVPADRLTLATDPAALTSADIILVTVKSAATAEIATSIAAFANRNALIVSLQNGVGNASVLRAALPGRRIVAGMVPFNVVQMDDGRFHRGSAGALAIEAGYPDLLAALTVDGLAVTAHPDMVGVLWGKLLLNLNNALNALSDVPLVTQLSDRRWRQILAAMQKEALDLLTQAGIQPVKATPLPPRWVPHILRLPTWLYARIARSALTIDPEARSSMWEDLKQGRTTEIAWLQGAIVDLAASLGQAAPINAHILSLIRKAEAAGSGPPRMNPQQVLSDVVALQSS